MSNEANNQLFSAIQEDDIFKFVNAIENGGDINAVVDGMPLFLYTLRSVKSGKSPTYYEDDFDYMSDVFELIVDNAKTLNLDANKIFGGKPLIILLMEEKWWPAVKMLIKNGKELGIDFNLGIGADLGRAPLSYSLYYSKRDICDMLLDYKDELNIDIDRVDEYGRTALSWACLWGHLKIADRLLQIGARTDNLGHDNQTLFYDICYPYHKGEFEGGEKKAEVMDFLPWFLENKDKFNLDVNRPDKYGRTPFGVMLSYGGKLFEAIEFILQHKDELGVDPFKKSADKTPLQIIKDHDHDSTYGKEELLDLFQRYGVDR